MSSSSNLSRTIVCVIVHAHAHTRGKKFKCLVGANPGSCKGDEGGYVLVLPRLGTVVQPVENVVVAHAVADQDNL